MINNFPFSAASISVALIGITLSVLFTKPYTGGMRISDCKKEGTYKLRKR